jgi:hypothetical protein
MDPVESLRILFLHFILFFVDEPEQIPEDWSRYGSNDGGYGEVPTLNQLKILHLG